MSLERDPDNDLMQRKVFAASDSLPLFEKERADWVDQAIQARWLVDGDRCTTLFFKNFKGMAIAKQIPALIDDQGLTANSWEEMADIVKNFFVKGLGENAPPP